MSKRRKKRNPSISATVSVETKKQLNDLRIKRNTTYADLIRNALSKQYGIRI